MVAQPINQLNTGSNIYAPCRPRSLHIRGLLDADRIRRGCPSAVITDISKDNGKSLSMIYIINICTSFCFRPKRCELAHELNLPENTIKVIYYTFNTQRPQANYNGLMTYGRKDLAVEVAQRIKTCNCKKESFCLLKNKSFQERTESNLQRSLRAYKTSALKRTVELFRNLLRLT